MLRAMREVAPDAKLVSWFYQPHSDATRNDWVYEAVKHVREVYLAKGGRLDGKGVLPC